MKSKGWVQVVVKITIWQDLVSGLDAEGREAGSTSLRLQRVFLADAKQLHRNKAGIMVYSGPDGVGAWPPL